MKKLSLPVVITIFCVIIFLGLMAAVLTKEKKLVQLGKVEKVKKEEIKRTDYTQVARRTLDWIDEQRNEQGWYILERGCDHETKTCDVVWDNKEGNKDGLIATWARLNFFEQHGDSKDLEIVKRDIDLFYDKYKDDNLKDSLWLCKTSYEMAQSKHLDQARKEKLKELCAGVEYPSAKEVEEHWLLGRTKKLKDSIKVKVWEDWDFYGVTLRGFDASLGYPTDLLFRYKWLGNKKDLTAAKEILAVTKKIYSDKVEASLDKQLIRYPEDICLNMMSAIDMYNEDKDETDLDFAKKTYEQTVANLDKAVDFQTPICGLVDGKFLELTGDKKYLKELEKNNRVVVGLYSDGENTKIVSDGGFFKSDGKNKFVVYKNVVENGLIVELLRN